MTSSDTNEDGEKGMERRLQRRTIKKNAPKGHSTRGDSSRIRWDLTPPWAFGSAVLPSAAGPCSPVAVHGVDASIPASGPLPQLSTIAASALSQAVLSAKPAQPSKQSESLRSARVLHRPRRASPLHDPRLPGFENGQSLGQARSPQARDSKSALPHAAQPRWAAHDENVLSRVPLPVSTNTCQLASVSFEKTHAVQSGPSAALMSSKRETALVGTRARTSSMFFWVHTARGGAGGFH